MTQYFICQNSICYQPCIMCVSDGCLPPFKCLFYDTSVVAIIPKWKKVSFRKIVEEIKRTPENRNYYQCDSCESDVRVCVCMCSTAWEESWGPRISPYGGSVVWNKKTFSDLITLAKNDMRSKRERYYVCKSCTNNEKQCTYMSQDGTAPIKCIFSEMRTGWVEVDYDTYRKSCTEAARRATAAIKKIVRLQNQ